MFVTFRKEVARMYRLHTVTIEIPFRLLGRLARIAVMIKSVFRAFGFSRHHGGGDAHLEISVSEIRAAGNQKDNKAAKEAKANLLSASKVYDVTTKSSSKSPKSSTSRDGVKDGVKERPQRPQRPSTLQRFTRDAVSPDRIISADRIVTEYDLARVIGESKTAVVSLAVNNVTKERVAIKRHPKRNGDSHVYKEAALQSVLDHPSIAGLRAFAENESYLYLVQEYCAGGELFDAVAPDVGCPPHVARSYTLQLFKALAYIHGKGIAHRDLKPENIMLTADKSSIKVIDFGLSEYCIPGARYKQHIGTVPYMAAELWTPTSSGYAEIDLKAADVWAAGVVLYCMMSGRFPWSEATSRSPEFRRYREGDFTFAPWPELGLKHPAALDLLLHMLDLNPTRRWTVDQCIDFIETKWIVDPPARTPPKTKKRPVNLRISVAKKNVDGEPIPSPLALSPQRELTSGDCFRFTAEPNLHVAGA